MNRKRNTHSFVFTKPSMGMYNYNQYLNRHLWSIICISTVLVTLTGYIILVSSNAIYLGWHDTIYFFTHSRMWQRFWLTVWTASISTVFSLIIGIPAGYAISRLRFPCPKVVNTLIDLPIMIPPAAVGAFLFGLVHTFPAKNLIDFLGIEFAHNTPGVILVQFTVTVAFCTRLMKASFDTVNARFELVSRSLGASLPRTFFKVTIPLAKNGIIASSIIVFARAAAEWEALMLFVGGTEGQTDIMPFAVYLDWNGAMMGWVVSMSLVCVLLAIASMGAFRIIGGKNYVW